MNSAVGRLDLGYVRRAEQVVVKRDARDRIHVCEIKRLLVILGSFVSLVFLVHLRFYHFPQRRFPKFYTFSGKFFKKCTFFRSKILFIWGNS